MGPRHSKNTEQIAHDSHMTAGLQHVVGAVVARRQKDGLTPGTQPDAVQLLSTEWVRTQP